MTANIGTVQAASILRALGWPSTVPTSTALTAFQAGWGFRALTADGVLGPLTSTALQQAEARRMRGLPTASGHFSFTEFACQCRGRCHGCRGILVRRELLVGLEKLRTRYPSGLKIVSGYRCPGHNAATKGAASKSQHMYGTAADIEYLLTDRTVAGLGVFSGIGRSGSTHKVRHVDVRHVSAYNPAHATVTHPTVWDYAK